MTDLFEGVEFKNEFTGKTCKDCIHKEAVWCNSRFIQYCKRIYSGRTYNKMLKVKCKTEACRLFEPHT